MWNRLQSRIGGRGIVVLAVALVAVVVGAVLLLGSGDEETTAEPQATVTGDAATETAEPAKQDGEDTGKERPSGPDDEAATRAPSGVPEEFADFRDCVRDHGGIPIDLDELPENTDGGSEPEGEDVPAALEDYTPQEIENLREARAACIDGLSGEARDRAEQIADSPFRSCVAAEQELGKELVEAVLACEDELPEGDELPPNFGEDGARPFGPGGPQDGEGPPGD